MGGGPLDHNCMLLRLCALMAGLGILGCVAAFVTMGALSEGHDWVSDSLATLGTGRTAWAQAPGLLSLSTALLALAVASAHLHRPGDGRAGVAFCLGGLAIIAAIMAGRGTVEGGAFGDALLAVIVALFAGAFFAGARGLGDIHPGFRTASLTVGGVWVVAAPLFLFLPTTADGFWQICLGLLACVWIGLFAAGLWRLSTVRPPASQAKAPNVVEFPQVSKTG